MAAKRLGLEMVPVDRQDYKDERDEHGDLYGDNKISEYAEIDGAMETELLGGFTASRSELGAIREHFGAWIRSSHAAVVVGLYSRGLMRGGACAGMPIITT